MAEDDAGHRLVLDVAQRLFLEPREVGDPSLRELDVRPLALTRRQQASIAARFSRNSSGDQPSNRTEYSRTAASPRASIAPRMSSTVRRTFASASVLASPLIPVLR